MKHDYTKLDAAILAALSADRPKTFTELERGEVHLIAAALSEQLATPFERRMKPGWRFVDSRLQALRKAGHIRYQRKPEGWVLAAGGK